MGIFSKVFGKKKAAGNPADAKFMSGQYYQGAGQGRLKSDWLVGSMNSSDPNSYTTQVLRNRCRDLLRNDPVFAAVIGTFVTNVIGKGLSVQPNINAKRLGVSEDKANKIQESFEEIFKDWMPYADKAGVLNFNEYQRLVFKKILIDGESIVLPTWNDSTWRPYGRCLQALESEELDVNWIPDKRTMNGITFDTYGAPSKYWIRQYEKTEMGPHISTKPIGIDSRDKAGRPKLLHIFETDRPNQTRGIPKMSSAISKFNDLDEYIEAELVSARVQACLSVFINKADSIGSAIAMSNGQVEEGGARLEEIEPGGVNYLGIGEQIQVVDPKRNDSMGTFIETILRTVGMSVGLPYELLVKDFSKTNYSSARAALLEARRQFDYYRIWIAEKFCQPIYEMVLEEAFLRNELPITQRQFETKWHILKKATWIGAPFGQIDEVKETQAAILRIDSGMSSYADELVGQGRDWKDVFAQKAREKEVAEQLDLNLVTTTSVSKGGQQEKAIESKEEESEGGEE